jgi:hypothetical protein
MATKKTIKSKTAKEARVKKDAQPQEKKLSCYRRCGPSPCRDQ